MNSPFKMKPGRGNMPKTGNGIPPTLMACSPMKQEKPKKGKVAAPSTEIELTMDYDRGKRLMAEARKAPGKIEDLRKVQGINVDAATGGATVAKYEKTYQQGSKGQKDRIIGGDGKVMAEAKATNFVKGEKNKDLYKQFQKDSINTMNSRNRYATQYNITSGAKSTNNATEKEKQLLVSLGKAKKTN
jgi:hypothetical protein